MPRRVAVQMDPLESVKFSHDSGVLLCKEATRRGYEIHHYTPQDLAFREGKVLACARSVVFHDDLEKPYTAGEARLLDLSGVDVVLMRQDPPFDMGYITATYILDMLNPKPLVVNNPAAVRNAPEKLFLFRFPQYVAPTMVSRDYEAIAGFLEAQGEIVLKPLYSFGGRSVFRLKKGDTNLRPTLDMFFAQSSEPVIAQRFLPDIFTLEKRIILIDGQVTSYMARRAPPGQIRTSANAGGSVGPYEPTPRDVEIAETVAKAMKEQDILLASIDVIGDYLTEINVTSPSSLVDTNEMYGLKQERLVWDAIEKRLK